MVSLSRPQSRKSTSVRNRAARPWLEQLERRDCPAAPIITNFAARILSSNSVELTGNVHDDHLDVLTVEISGGGSVGVQVQLDSNFNGQFALSVTSVNTAATFFAVASDGQSVNSPQVQTVPANAPTLTLAAIQQANRQVRVSGTVNDTTLNGLTVNLSGIVTGSATTDTSGNFVFTGTASALGVVSATTTNANNATSNTAQATLTNVAPQITNFTASVSGNTWTFTGSVVDEWAMGLTVSLTAPNVLNPFTATVGSDNNFSVSVNIANFPFGSATAQTTDWWGVASNQAQCPVRAGSS